MIFICPKCKEKLNITDSGTARCAGGHSYDRSRQGYYNLLMSERGGTHGDNSEMVAARRAFLSAGHYEPFAREIAGICRSLIPEGGILLDAGCGEGYYTERVRRELAKKNARVAAFDISKDAVIRAARRSAADEYAVAGSYHMPLADASVDVLLNTFSPMAAEESARVVADGGYFVMAIPGEEHLFGLKSAIYDEPYKNRPKDTALEGFSLVEKRELRYTLTLEKQEDIRALFMMTPYAYRTDDVGRERVLSLASLTTEAHFIILIYRRL
ncbi:MAG: methyltransferase domain-containing protein [Ruminococcaceae bacterium]|nr:methyltransferase domain-containing protein [Oscillospiraceae bacterium]